MNLLRKSQWATRIAVLLAAQLVIGSFAVHAQEKKEGKVEKFGVIHNIADDREVINVGGIYEPEGLDIYLKRKFDDLLTRIKSLEDKTNELSQQLSKQMKQMQEIVNRISEKN